MFDWVFDPTIVGCMFTVYFASMRAADENGFVVSPDVSKFGLVTFRFNSESAKHVRLVVDGIDVIDPKNTWMKKWLACRSSVEVIGSDETFSPLTQARSVPHGVTHRHLVFVQGHRARSRCGCLHSAPF